MTRSTVGVCVACMAIVLSACFAEHCPAALLVPNGNPTAGPTAGTPQTGTSTLIPTPAVYMTAGSCPWLLPALAKEGFSAANNWTIKTVALQGNIELGTYEPWANTDPGFKQGAFSSTESNFEGYGGANLGLDYQPSTAANSTDPIGPDVHWIQAIYTKTPLPFETTNGVPYDAGTICIDNGYNYTDENKNTTAPSNPFYDGLNGAGYKANDDSFFDSAARTLASNALFEGQAFIATWNPKDANNVKMGGTITIYDGVWWGFQLAAPVPEPSSFLLASLAGLAMGATALRRVKQGSRASSS